MDQKRKISCVIADQSLGWALGIAEKHGIKRAAFCPAAAAAALLVLGFNIPKLIDEGVIDQDGEFLHLYMSNRLAYLTKQNMSDMQVPDISICSIQCDCILFCSPFKSEVIKLSPDVPPMNMKNCVWA
ncbi:hypothetical protein V6N13_028439 [Hibiscus sabdariffa]|uniref:Uncharacterized protein n=1 Tax=Hibiscus sabdariffa TaxID=183260 RepID=A0ABR2DAE8_9ROSI